MKISVKHPYNGVYQYLIYQLQKFDLKKYHTHVPEMPIYIGMGTLCRGKSLSNDEIDMIFEIFKKKIFNLIPHTCL